MDYKYHKCNKINDWKRRGVILREGETYDIFYDRWVNATHCESCNVKLDFSGSGKNGRCLDHDHDTGYFRNILCNSCNHKRQVSVRVLYKSNKTGYKYIYYSESSKRWKYCQKSHGKSFKTLEEAIQYKEKYEKGFRTELQTNNTTGIKNISQDKSNGRWRYSKKLNGNSHTKSFKTLEEAIQYKINYEKNM